MFGGVWLVSFADLMSILVTFFVMLYSTTDVQPETWEALREGLAEGLGQSASQAIEPSSVIRAPAGEAIGVNLDYLAVLLEERIAAEGGEAEITVVRRSDRIIIALAARDLFVPAHVSVSDEAARRLARIAGLLTHVRNRIEVTAFSPDLQRGRAESAWEISIGRAHAVAQTFRRAGYTRDIVALATGGSEARKLGGVANSTDGADRIEIHVLGVMP
jgi:chemotaxis protein MotB